MAQQIILDKTEVVSFYNARYDLPIVEFRLNKSNGPTRYLYFNEVDDPDYYISGALDNPYEWKWKKGDVIILKKNGKNYKEFARSKVYKSKPN